MIAADAHDSDRSFYFPRNAAFGHQQAADGIIKDGLWDVYNQFHMGVCAEGTAEKHSLTREDQDNFAIESYRRAADAWKAGAFKDEIVPVEIPDPRTGKPTIVEEDEEYKNIKLDKVKSLRPVFKKEGGTITAANASNLNDGASAVVLMSGSKVEETGVKPLAKIICASSLAAFAALPARLA